jgi:Pyridoxamine 5'-phosphate oxidase
MAKFYDSISQKHQEFIEAQKMFFVATAAEDGRINLSPKGLDSLRVLDGNRVLWLNMTGSGNETAAHLKLVNRMTIMFCAFEGNPLIMRLYGSARAIHTQDADWEEYYEHFDKARGVRQVFEMKVETLQTSCGFAVPLMEYTEDRAILNDWVDKKIDAEIQDYWAEKNQESIDGKPTGIFEGVSL